MSGQNQKTDKRIAWPIIIMNFTGVYDYEAFAGTINLYGWIVVIFMVQMATVTGRGLWL